MSELFLTTTDQVDAWRVRNYCGLVAGQAVYCQPFGAAFGTFGKAFSGGRVPELEKGLRTAKDQAVGSLSEEAAGLGANAVIGIRIDYETLGEGGMALMVCVSGTAVVLEPVAGS
ncbi:MAG: hypothetical protein PWP23_2703 [Candidatus Sumerlaeota bacterium]|nr:hypothetical protein [Candidatus Sumerlaeota bacterium]